ncbi:hypothetical protein [Pseudomonas sp. RC10]|uniref:hypothetical protein n=1 Tax=Pseudomonas bambusae TaxID=3139142 RepID=UPI00313986F9
MSNHHETAVTMIERQIERIRISDYPNSEFCQGMIQANYAQGFIDEQQLEAYEQLASDAVLTRRRAIRTAVMVRKLSSLHQLHGAQS